MTSKALGSELATSASEGVQKAKCQYFLQTGEGISLHTARLGKFPNFSVSDSPLPTEIQAPLTPQRYFVDHQLLLLFENMKC